MKLKHLVVGLGILELLYVIYITIFDNKNTLAFVEDDANGGLAVIFIISWVAIIVICLWFIIVKVVDNWNKEIF